jgi:two-component system, chemotaxis family, protein-glutamate methylesterase/glutaminase
MDRVLRVLVVDDSAYVRKVIKQMLTRSPFIEVIGTARDGEEALEMVEQLKPDVVTLDLVMPRMDGVEFLRTQMARCPVPVVITSIASENSEMVLAALDAGAVDFVQKPTALATEKIYEIGEELVEKVKMAAQISIAKLRIDTTEIVPVKSRIVVPSTGMVDIVVIGISTGGPQGLRYLIPQFPADFPVPIAIVMHMPVGYTEMYARKLNEISTLQVSEAEEGGEVVAGKVLLAPAGRHLTLRQNPSGSVVTHLDMRPLDSLHRPSVDVLFQSVAEVYHGRVLGVVMTGMGSDGKQGSAWIKAQGGVIFTEAEESCVVYGMPLSVVEAGLSDRVVPLESIAQAILEVV